MMSKIVVARSINKLVILGLQLLEAPEKYGTMTHGPILDATRLTRL